MTTAANAWSRASLRPVLVAVLLLVAWGLWWFVSLTYDHYSRFDPAAWGDYFWVRRLGLLPHMLAGLVASTTGLVQLWLGLTGRAGRLHRVLGRVYGASIVVAAAGSFYLSWSIPATDRGYSSGLFLLGVAWLVTTGLAVWAARRRNFQQHRDWMIRSYTVTFAFVAFRIGDKWLGPMHLMSADQFEVMLAWGCWALPLLVMEPVIQWKALSR